MRVSNRSVSSISVRSVSVTAGSSDLVTVAVGAAVVVDAEPTQVGVLGLDVNRRGVVDLHVAERLALGRRAQVNAGRHRVRRGSGCRCPGDRCRNSARLRTRFGPEDDHAVLTHGSARKAEAKLAERETRVDAMKLRELTATEKSRFIVDWQAVQSRFVDHPKGSVTEADEVISAMLVARGYPVTDFDRRAADVSVNHPRLVEYYRSAHGVIVRLGKEEATTEDLRNAMIQYRSLFEELLEPRAPAVITTAA